MNTFKAFLLSRRSWLRKRVRENTGFFYGLIKGSPFVGRRLGLKLLFDLNSTIDKSLLAFWSYEKKQQDILFSSARDGVRSGERTIFLDIGANWGVYALVAESSKIYDRIIAVEADSRNASQLHANLFLNNLSDKVDVVCAAASDSSTAVEFNLAPNRSRDVSRAGETVNRPGWEKKTVPAVRIDDLEPMNGGFVVGKIDVEGFEDKVIDGMKNLLTGNRCCLQIEVFADTLEAFTHKMAALGFHKFDEVKDDHYFKNY